jgi:hypothetical protein
MDLLILVFIIVFLVIGISPAKVKFEGEDIIFSIPLLFVEKRKKKAGLKSYRIKMSAFPIILRFEDGTVLKWTSFPQWRCSKTRSALDQILKTRPNQPAQVNPCNPAENPRIT